MKKILIALDYDPTAQIVAETGYSMAKEMNAEIVLLHVVAEPVYYSSTGYSPIMGFVGYLDMKPNELDSDEIIKKTSQEFLEKSKQHLGDKAIKTRIAEGDFADSIISVAKELHSDIIVMGSHSRKWLESILMGSVTENVLRNTSIPVLIVSTKKQD